MRRNGILLVLLMLFMSISPLATELTSEELEPIEEKEHSISLNSGWGESLAGEDLLDPSLRLQALGQSY